MFKPLRVLVLLAVLPASSITARHAAPSADTPWLDPYREPASRLIGEAMSSPFAWNRLALIGDTFGHRLSGSRALEDAIQWAVAEMKKDGLENVHAEPRRPCLFGATSLAMGRAVLGRRPVRR